MEERKCMKSQVCLDHMNEFARFLIVMLLLMLLVLIDHSNNKSKNTGK